MGVTGFQLCLCKKERTWWKEQDSHLLESHLHVGLPLEQTSGNGVLISKPGCPFLQSGFAESTFAQLRFPCFAVLGWQRPFCAGFPPHCSLPERPPNLQHLLFQSGLFSYTSYFPDIPTTLLSLRKAVGRACKATACLGASVPPRQALVFPLGSFVQGYFSGSSQEAGDVTPTSLLDPTLHLPEQLLNSEKEPATVCNKPPSISTSLPPPISSSSSSLNSSKSYYGHLSHNIAGVSWIPAKGLCAGTDLELSFSARFFLKTFGAELNLNPLKEEFWTCTPWNCLVGEYYNDLNLQRASSLRSSIWFLRSEPWSVTNEKFWGPKLSSISFCPDIDFFSFEGLNYLLQG